MKLAPLMLVVVVLAGGVALADWRHGSDKPYRVDERRDYMQRSVKTVQGDARSIVARVKAWLAKIHVTPARLALGLGILGVLLTLNRNTKLVHWAVIAGLSWLLLIFGVAAMFFDWPAFN